MGEPGVVALEGSEGETGVLVGEMGWNVEEC